MDYFVYPDAGQLPGGTTTANLGTELAPWIGWPSVVWGGVGVKGGDRLRVFGSWMLSAVISVGAHGASSVSARCTVFIEDGTVIDFVTKTHYLQNTQPYTEIRGSGMHAGAGQLLSVLHAPTAVFSEYDNFRLSASGAGSAFRIGGSSQAGVFRDFYMHDLYITNGNAVLTSSIAGAIQAWTDPGVAKIYQSITIERIAIENFSAARGVLSIFAAQNANARAQDIIIRNITFKNIAGLALDIECAGPDSGLDVPATIDWSAGIIIQNITVEDQVYATNSSGGVTNFGGVGFISGFGLSSTPGFGENRIDNIAAKNIQGDAGFIDILAGTYNGRQWSVDGLTTKNIDACVLLLDSGCHNCLFEGIEARNVTGKAGVDHAGSVVLVLDNVRDVQVTGIKADNVWSILGAYNTNNGANVTVSNVTATNVKGWGSCISANVPDPNAQRLLNATVQGTGAAVVNKSAKAWTGEDSNYFNMTGTTVNHTFGTASKIGVDPQIDAVTGRPKSGSPLIGTGKFAAYGKDVSGQRCKLPPTIGAYEDYTLLPRVRRT